MVTSILTRGGLASLGPRLNLDFVKTVLFYYVLAVYGLKAKRHLTARGVVTSFREIYESIARVCNSLILSCQSHSKTYLKSTIQKAFQLALKLPSVKKKADEQLSKAKLDIENKLVPKGPNVVRHLALPEESRSLEWILAEMNKMDEEFEHASDWKGGKVSGAVYRESTTQSEESYLKKLTFSLDGGDDLEKIIVAAYAKYCVSNPLHPDVFPAVRKMEAEIVAMTLRMYNHPNGAGAMTSGGTESIIMAVKAYRDWGRAVKGITEPEMYESYCPRIPSH